MVTSACAIARLTLETLLFSLLSVIKLVASDLARMKKFPEPLGMVKLIFSAKLRLVELNADES